MRAAIAPLPVFALFIPRKEGWAERPSRARMGGSPLAVAACLRPSIRSRQACLP